MTDTGVQLGQIGAWFNPRYDDDTRTEFVIQAEKLGYPTAWLGGGRASDLSLVERVLDETTTIIVVTAIVNMWTNHPADIAESYQRIAARHGDRFLLGIGIGHPESITTYCQPYATMVDYLDQLDAGGVPRDRRIIAALGPRALRLAADRTLVARQATFARFTSSWSLAAGRPPVSPPGAGTRAAARLWSSRALEVVGSHR